MSTQTFFSHTISDLISRNSSLISRKRQKRTVILHKLWAEALL